MSDFLKKIRALTEARVVAAKLAGSLSETSSRTPHDFTAKLMAGPAPRIIAEVKRASPSRGPIATVLDPVDVACQYFAQGAAAISVLTEPTHFGGRLEDLENIRRALPGAVLLMKDFIIDPYQLLQAKAAGADAILLMMSLLGPELLKELFHQSRELGLTPLVEVHDAREMELALSVGAPIIGVNNRNLRTLQVSLEVSRELATLSTNDSVLISESGIENREQIDDLSARGFDAFLIGSSLTENLRPGEALRALLQKPLEVKICGVTRTEDALAAEGLGATMIGLIFADESPRGVNFEKAMAIVKALAPQTRVVGVFISEQTVLQTLDTVDLHGVQCHGFNPSRGLLAELKERGVFSIRAFSLSDRTNAQEIESSACDLVLLDVSKNEAAPALSSELVRNLKLKRRFLIAGGILPETAPAYIKDLRPAGLDIASGVEREPGVKSEAKLRHLFAEIERSRK